MTAFRIPLGLLVLASAGPVRAQAGDGEIDALPPGAVARFGTLRFTHCRAAAYSLDGKLVAAAAASSGPPSRRSRPTGTPFGSPPIRLWPSWTPAPARSSS